ncbi:MAG: Slp family lipoprotein [Rhodanobacteraceae bacterium]|nr:Slp family lipoprotein [Rhodanobacteraceae bacterium]
MPLIRWSLPIIALALAACATAPKPLRGEFAAAPQPPAADGQKVRWGGEIIRTVNAAERSCFEVLARPLDARARPQRQDHSEGRFLACRSGFYDPAVFAAGREITVIGSIVGDEIRKVGDYDYRYPRVAADVIYLWSERAATNYHQRWFYDPFWHRPWWGPAHLVIHHSHSRRAK